MGGAEVSVIPLAQARDGYGGIMIWSLGLVLLLALMGFAIARFRKRMSQSDVTPAGFTLGELRQLHRTGKMTDAEFEVAKNLVLKGLKTSLGPSDRTQRPPGTGKLP
jgi:hypothetical protein